jgi:hypothetical protein
VKNVRTIPTPKTTKVRRRRTFGASYAKNSKAFESGLEVEVPNRSLVSVLAIIGRAG